MPAEVEFQDLGMVRFLQKLTIKTKQYEKKHKEVIGLFSSVVYRDIMSHFKNETGPDGKWKHWSFAYTLFMEKIGKGGNKILQDTGRLRQTFVPQKYRTSDAGVLFYNNAKTKGGFEYAEHHDKTRPFMWLSDKGAEDISKNVLAFMLEDK